MKSLITTILLIITAVSLTGCTVVKERYYGRRTHEIIVTQPRHRSVRVIPPRRPGPPQHEGRQGRPGPSHPRSGHD